MTSIDKHHFSFITSNQLFENLKVTQLVEKFPAFYGSRRFITAFTRARHWILS